MPPFDAPLPLTSLVWRALCFAEDYYEMLGVSLARLAALRRMLDAEPTPHFSARGSDTVDRYDVAAGCILYVRPRLVVLVGEQAILYVDATRQLLSIRARLTAATITPDTSPMLLEAPLWG